MKNASRNASGISSTTSEVVEVCFNYSGVFLQVKIEPLLARFTVSCLLPLVKKGLI